MHLVDAVAWVQSDMAEAERRGIERDGGDEAAISFCKFGAGTAFTDQWITGGSMRYAPIRDLLLALHRDAAAEREKAAAGG